MFRRMAVLLATGIILVGCGRNPYSYDIPVADAYGLLMALDLSDLSVNLGCGVDLKTKPVGVPNQWVSWRVTSVTHSLIDINAVLSPVNSNETRVHVVISDAPEAKSDHSNLNDIQRPAFRLLLRQAVIGKVADLLDRKGKPARRRPRGIVPVCDESEGGSH